MAHQLKKMAELNMVSIDLGLAKIKKSLQEGDVYLAKYQVEALEGILPEGSQELNSFKETLATPESLELMESRSRFYQSVIKDFGVSGLRGFWEHPVPPFPDDWRRNKLRNLLGLTKGFYKKQAEKVKKIFGPNPITHQLTKATTITAKESSVNNDFDLEDPSKIQELRVVWNLKGKMAVALNGTMILDVNVPKGKKDTEVILKPITLELLKKGKNTLSLTGDSSDPALSGVLSLKGIEIPGS